MPKTTKTPGQTVADLRTRKRHPRALVNEMRRHISRGAATIAANWEVSRTTYDMVTENGRPNAKWRPARPDELPENQAEAWRHLEQQAHYLELLAGALRMYARDYRAARWPQ